MSIAETGVSIADHVEGAIRGWTYLGDLPEKHPDISAVRTDLGDPPRSHLINGEGGGRSTWEALRVTFSRRI